MRYEAYTHYLIYETRVINEAKKKKKSTANTGNVI